MFFPHKVLAASAIVLVLSGCVPEPPGYEADRTWQDHWEDPEYRLKFYDYASRTLIAFYIGVWTN